MFTGNCRGLLYHSSMPVSRPVKFAFYFIALLVLALVLALAAGLWLVDPDDYRDEIRELVKKQTGWELRLQGPLRLSIYPILGIELNEASIANPPGFGPAPLIEVGQATLGARLLPLLTGRLEIEQITLRRLAISLETDTQGRTNWTVAQHRPAAVPPGPATSPEPSDTGQARGQASGEDMRLAALAIGGIAVEDARLHWSDRRSGQDFAIEQLALTSGPIAPNRPVALSARGRLAGRQPALSGQFDLSARLIAPPDLATLQAEDLEIDLQVEGADLPRKRLRLQLAGDLMLSPDDETLRVSALTARLDETSRLEGELRLRGFTRPAVRFTARLDRLDLDRYLPPEPSTTGANKQETVAPPASTAAAGLLELPMEELRALDLQGALEIAQFQARGLRLEDLRARLAAQDGLLRLDPFSALLYGGRYEGRATLDVRGDVPAFTLDERLTEVQLAPLLEDFMDRAVVRGRAAATVRLQGRGRTTNELLRSLEGQVSLMLRDGEIEGVNLARLAREAQALLQGKPPAAAADAQATDFTALAATVHFSSGTARNDDLRLDAPFLRVRGRGSADLLRQRIDYRLLVRLVESAAGQGGKDQADGLEVPVLVEGDLAQPRFRLDKSFIEKKLRRKAERKLKKKLEKELRKQQEDKLEEKVQRQLKDALEKLF